MGNVIKGVAWFNSNSVVGIVLVDTEYDGEKAYISGVHIPTDSESDSIYIAKWGAKFPLNEAKSLISSQGGTVNIEY